nr:hypothetical protein [Tanacetum cinerariifolium]
SMVQVCCGVSDGVVVRSGGLWWSGKETGGDGIVLKCEYVVCGEIVSMAQVCCGVSDGLVVGSGGLWWSGKETGGDGIVGSGGKTG